MPSYGHTEQKENPMSQKTPNPKHDPAPDYEHTRRVHHETDNIMLVHYLPADEYGFTRLIHFTNDGDSTGYLDIDGHTSRAFDELTQLGADHVLFHAGNTVYHHNDRVRRLVKKDLTSFEIAQQVKAEKEALAEAAKPKVLTFDEEREARALKKAATTAAEAAVLQLAPRIHSRKWHATMTRAAKGRVDDLTALQFDATAIAQEQEKYEYHKQFADELPALEAELQQLQEASRQAYAKSVKTYWEEAHQHA